MNWKDLNVGTFSWSTCNKTVVPVAFTKFELNPDPLQFGQPLIFSGQVFVGEKIGTGNDVNVSTLDLWIFREHNDCQIKGLGARFNRCQV